MKKNIIFILFILISMYIFIYLYAKPKDYSLEYSVGSFKVTEKYEKKTATYHFLINNNKLKFETILIKKYTPKRKLISKINSFYDGKNNCITNNLTEPLCYDGNRYISYNLTTDVIKDKIKYQQPNNNDLLKKFKQTSIYNYFDNTYVIRNYRGFDFINEDKQKAINIFTKDIYYVDLIAQINNYILVADYNQNYAFSKFYVLDVKKQEVKEWQIDSEISFDSYILGVNDKSIFLVDRKNKIEYEIVPHKQKMRVIGTATKKGKIYKANNWQEISLQKLISKKYTFDYIQPYNYILKANQLYIKYPLSKNIQYISSLKVDAIVTQKAGEVFYLVADQLYSYNSQNHEKKLLQNPEWNFNKQNVVYVY